MGQAEVDFQKRILYSDNDNPLGSSARQVQRSAHRSSPIFMIKGGGLPDGTLPLLSRLPFVPRPPDGKGLCAAAEEGARALGSPDGVDTLLPLLRGESLGEAPSKDVNRLASPAPANFIGMISVLAARGMGGVLLAPSRKPFLARTPTVFGNASIPPLLALLISVGEGATVVLARVGELALKPEPCRSVAGLRGVDADDRFALTATGGVAGTPSAMGMVFERTILTFAASAVPWRGVCCFWNSSTPLRIPPAGEDEKTRRVRSALRSLSFFLRMASFSFVS